MTSNKTNSARLALLAGALAWCALCPSAHAADGAKGAPEQNIKLDIIGQGAKVNICQTINQCDPKMDKALEMLDRKDKETAQLQGKNQALEAEIRRLRAAAALRVVKKAQAPNASAADKRARDAFVKGDTAPTVAALEKEEATLTKQGKADLAKAAELARQQAVLLQDSDSARALQALKRAATLAPDNWWGLWLLGKAEQTAGHFGSAMAAFKKIQAIWASDKTSQPESGTFQNNKASLAVEVGDILVKQDDLPAALASFQRSLEIRQRLVTVEAGNTEWQRDLSVSLERIGDIQQAQDNLIAALDSFQRSLEIAQRLAAVDVGNTGWQRDLSVSQIKIGDIQQAQGYLPAALDSFQRSLEITQRLVALDAGNTEWQRDLSISLERLGDIQLAQGNLPVALASFRRSVEIHQRLAAHDHGNVQWQLDLVTPFTRLAAIAADSKQTDQARTWVDKALAILTQLKQQSRLPPANQGWIGLLKELRAELTEK